MKKRFGMFAFIALLVVIVLKLGLYGSGNGKPVQLREVMVINLTYEESGFYRLILQPRYGEILECYMDPMVVDSSFVQSLQTFGVQKRSIQLVALDKQGVIGPWNRPSGKYEIVGFIGNNQ